MAGPSKGQLKARLHSIATNHYWTTVERNLGLLMDFIAAIKCGNAPESPREWQTMLHMSAREAYQLACAQDTPRQMRAFAKGWKKLAFRVDENGEIKTDNANQEDQA
jgi:CRISPR system Cascade subunit CasA